MNWLPLISCVNLSRWANLLRRDFSLVSCLRTSLDSSASDPRDKVFAITGLLDPYIRAMIVIDYMLPVEEVFRQAVSVCIVERGDLELLEYAELPEIDGLTSTLTAPTFSMPHRQRRPTQSSVPHSFDPTVTFLQVNFSLDWKSAHAS
jgi:hypothetical protein